MGTCKRQASRLLPTYHPKWRAIRARVIAEEPWCRHCLQRGVHTPTTTVDHIDGDAATRHGYRRSNLQGLCKTCHDTKTALENGSFGRAPGESKRRGCDVDGTPLDTGHHWRKAGE